MFLAQHKMERISQNFLCERCGMLRNYLKNSKNSEKIGKFLRTPEISGRDFRNPNNF